jgi:hypothetical protein
MQYKQEISASVDGGKGKENHIILMVSIKRHMRWVEASGASFGDVTIR